MGFVPTEVGFSAIENRVSVTAVRCEPYKPPFYFNFYPGSGKFASEFSGFSVLRVYSE